jgi:hypothetical protein
MENGTILYHHKFVQLFFNKSLGASYQRKITQRCSFLHNSDCCLVFSKMALEPCHSPIWGSITLQRRYLDNNNCNHCRLVSFQAFRNYILLGLV